MNQRRDVPLNNLNLFSKKLAQKLRTIALTCAIILIFGGPFFAYFYAKYPYEDRFYPIWANHLFAGFPHIMRNFTIFVTEIDGKAFNPGLDLYSLFPTHEGEGRSPSVVIDQMGQALEQNREPDFSKAKESFEFQFFSSRKHVLYSIHKTNWIPIERYNSGKFKLNEILRNVEYSNTAH